MAVYSHDLRAAFNEAQQTLAKLMHVLLAHEPGRPRPYVVHLRSPSKPGHARSYTFAAEPELMTFFHALTAEAAGDASAASALVLVDHEPLPVVAPPARRRRSAKSKLQAAGVEDDTDDDGEDDDN